MFRTALGHRTKRIFKPQSMLTLQGKEKEAGKDMHIGKSKLHLQHAVNLY